MFANTEMPFPILITGAHRSGSTWVGRNLALSPKIAYIEEPFNIGRDRRALCDVEIPCWFFAVPEEETERYLDPMQHMVELRYGYLAAFRAVFQSPGFTSKKTTLIRSFQEAVEFYRGRRAHAHALLKDPIALFSAEWIARHLGAEVVVLIRHPAAFVSSLLRLDWSFDFTHLTSQASLMNGLIRPYADALQEQVHRPGTPLEQLILLWRVFHYVIFRYQQQHEDWLFLRHEDISSDPVTGFSTLYNRLDIEFTAAISENISQNSGASNPADTDAGVVHQLQRDSRAAMHNWKRRLTMEEIDQIRRETEDIAGKFYNDGDWL